MFVHPIVRCVALGAAALCIVAAAGAPAKASHFPSTAAFVGIARTPALGAPIIGSPGGGVWAIDVGGVGVSVGPGLVVGYVAGGTLHNGTLLPFGGAFCGASGGKGGSGNLAVGAWNVPVSNVGWDQSAGSLILFDGDAGAHTAGSANGRTADSELIGLASAIPTGGSCLTSSAQEFRVVGVWNIS